MPASAELRELMVLSEGACGVDFRGTYGGWQLGRMIQRLQSLLDGASDSLSFTWSVPLAVSGDPIAHVLAHYVQGLSKTETYVAASRWVKYMVGTIMLRNLRRASGLSWNALPGTAGGVMFEIFAHDCLRGQMSDLVLSEYRPAEGIAGLTRSFSKPVTPVLLFDGLGLHCQCPLI